MYIVHLDGVELLISASTSNFSFFLWCTNERHTNKHIWLHLTSSYDVQTKYLAKKGFADRCVLEWGLLFINH